MQIKNMVQEKTSLYLFAGAVLFCIWVAFLIPGTDVQDVGDDSGDMWEYKAVHVMAIVKDENLPGRRGCHAGGIGGLLDGVAILYHNAGTVIRCEL